MPLIDASSPLEDSVTGEGRKGLAPKEPNQAASAGSGAGADPANDPENLLSDQNLLRLAKAADRTATTFAQQNWLPAWDRSYKAFRNEHFAGSKYLSEEFKHRSRLFRPKTRTAVLKDLASTAASLFATIDAVTCSPGNETDPMQVANAELQEELINYRLDRTSGKNAISWFLTSMGARQDAVITGICCSKQYWEYEEKPVRDRMMASTALSSVDDEAAETMPDAEGAGDGDMPVPGADRTVNATDNGPPEPIKRKTKVVKDKPCIDLLPPENIGMHPAAHWMDPVNDGAFFNAWYPMVVDDVRAMMRDDKQFPWRDVTDAQLYASRVQQFESGQVRRAREGGKDRYNDQRASITEFDVVWVCERFIRIEGEDYCYWTLADMAVLSDPVPTENAYPAYAGERPYRVGLGAMESHRIVPMSKVEAGQPLQQEINDTVNLRMDNVKEALKPLTLVKRGKKIDLDRLKRRGSNTTMLVDDPEKDIKFDRPTDVSSSGYVEMERLNVDFDDMMGVFNSGSVQTNRSLNETVGGMKILSGAANAQTEFDVRIWIETWVEPVLAQLAKLEAYYESDDKVLAIATTRADLFQKYGISDVTDEMLENEVYVRVSAGVGSPDPMQKLQKLDAATKVFTPIFSASKEAQMGVVQPNLEEFANEIYGAAGVRDAYKRLFKAGQPTPQPGAMHQPGASPQEIAANSADHAATNASREKIAALNVKGKIAAQLIGHAAAKKAQKADHTKDNRHKFLDVLSEALGQKEQAKQRQAQAQQNFGRGGPVRSPPPGGPRPPQMPSAPVEPQPQPAAAAPPLPQPPVQAR